MLVFVRNSPAVCDCLLHRATCDDGQHLDQKTNIIQGFCWRDEVVADRHEESEGAGGEAEGEQVQLAILARRVHLDIPMRLRLGMRMRMRMRIIMGMRMRNNDSDNDDNNRIEREESIGKAERENRRGDRDRCWSCWVLGPPCSATQPGVDEHDFDC